MNTASEIPATATRLGESPEFTQDTVPQALLSRHETAPDRWAELCVLDGQLTFVDLVTKERQTIEAGGRRVITPASPHHVELHGPVRFQLRFWANLD